MKSKTDPITSQTLLVYRKSRIANRLIFVLFECSDVSTKGQLNTSETCILKFHQIRESQKKVMLTTRKKEQQSSLHKNVKGKMNLLVVTLIRSDCNLKIQKIVLAIGEGNRCCLCQIQLTNICNLHANTASCQIHILHTKNHHNSSLQKNSIACHLHHKPWFNTS